MNNGIPLPPNTVVMLWRSWMGVGEESTPLVFSVCVSLHPQRGDCGECVVPGHLAHQASKHGYSVVMCPQDRHLHTPDNTFVLGLMQIIPAPCWRVVFKPVRFGRPAVWGTYMDQFQSRNGASDAFGAIGGDDVDRVDVDRAIGRSVDRGRSVDPSSLFPWESRQSTSTEVFWTRRKSTSPSECGGVHAAVKVCVLQTFGIAVWRVFFLCVFLCMPVCPLIQQRCLVSRPAMVCVSRGWTSMAMEPRSWEVKGSFGVSYLATQAVVFGCSWSNEVNIWKSNEHTLTLCTKVYCWRS